MKSWKYKFGLVRKFLPSNEQVLPSLNTANGLGYSVHLCPSRPSQGTVNGGAVSK